MTNEILTQNADWTQMGDDEDDDNDTASQLERQATLLRSPMTPPRPQPWGRFMPCSAAGTIIQLLLRSPTYKSNSNHHQRQQQNSNSNNDNNKSPNIHNPPFVQWEHPAAFLRNIKPCDIFNVHTIGRSTKCDVQAKNPSILCPSSRNSTNKTLNIRNNSSSDNTTVMDKKRHARQEWCYGMISNQHCKIYCTIDAISLANADVHDHDSDDSIAKKVLPLVQVWVEDCSGNGTIINGTTVLMKGDKRLLHSGDEICLIQSATVQKKVVSRTELQTLLHEYSFVFINCINLSAGANTTNITTPPSLSFPADITNHRTSSLLSTTACVAGIPMVPSTTKRKAAVNVRATKSTRIRHNIVNPHAQEYTQSSSTLSQGATMTQGRKRKSSVSSDLEHSQVNPNRRISPRRQPPRRVQEEYDIRDVLGSGTMGEVRRALHRRTGEAVAIKMIPIQRNTIGIPTNHAMFMASNTSTTLEIEMEAEMLRKLQHPYIVKLIDVYTCPQAVYLVMEIVQGGDLFDRIVQKGHYSERDSRRVMRRLLAAVHYLHNDFGLVHRDLKPENILLTSSSSDIDVKLTDFGLAKPDGNLKTFCGTPQYFAPEVLRRRHTVKGNGRYGKQADMWSLGVILYVLLTGTPPYDTDDRGGNPYSMLSSQSNGDSLSHQLEFPNTISLSAQDMVRQLLQHDPKKRASIVSACTHEWILQDDGDTHIHPLEDPKLPNYTASSLPDKMFQATSSITNANVSVNETSPVAPFDDTSDLRNVTPHSKKIATSAKNFSYEKEFYSDTKDQPPLQLNHDKAQIALPPVVVKTPMFQSKNLSSTGCKIVKQAEPTTHVTPVTELMTVMNTSVPPSVVPTIGTTYSILDHSHVPSVEDHDDGILSRFSENTESVGSFSTANTYEFAPIAKAVKPKRLEPGNKSKSLLTKKKRSLSNISPSSKMPTGKTLKQSNQNSSRATGSSALKTKKTTRFRTDAPPQPPPIASYETNQSTKKNTAAVANGGSGGKQLTLNTWFKRHI
jgi:serine/threonine protein kinase